MSRWPCGWKHVVREASDGRKDGTFQGRAEHVLRAPMWEEGRLGLCGPPCCGTAPGPSSQEVRLHAAIVMPCSPFLPLHLQPRLSSSPCFWPASTAAATPGSTCSSRATSSKTLQRFLCCSFRLKGSQPGRRASAKIHSYTFVLSRLAQPEKLLSQPSTV